jgi:putative FmdB family regulatory protein
MPTYVYRCSKCGHVFEEFHGIKDTKPRKCPKCGKRAAKVPAGGAGLLFKGSGFYLTDYRSASYREAAKQESGGSKSGEKSAPSEKSSSKPEKSGASRADRPRKTGD